MRLIVCDNGLERRSGHNYNLDHGLREEAARRGLSLELWAHAGVEPGMGAELGAVPVFRVSPYAIDDAAGEQLRRFGEIGGCFAADLAEAAPRAEDVLFVPYARAAEIYGLARWLANGGSAAAVCLNFMHDDFRSRRADVTWVQPILYRYALAQLAVQLHPDRLLLTSGSSVLRANVGSVTGLTVREYPPPKAYPDLPEQPRAAAPVVACPGRPRKDKGFHRLPDIARACAASGLDCTLLIQSASAQDDPRAAARSEELRRLPGVELAEGPLSREAYYRLLARADVVLLPYKGRRYRARTSGPFMEALAHGKVTVVPDDTWMARQLEEGHGAGVAFGSEKPEAIAAALGEALRRLEPLRELAAARACAWRSQYGLGAYVGRLLADLRVAGVDAD